MPSGPIDQPDSTGAPTAGPWLFEVAAALTEGRTGDAADIAASIAAGGDPRGLTAQAIATTAGADPSPSELAHAVDLFERAAAQDEPVALLRLGQALHDGRGTSVDLERAVSCFERAGSLGSSEAARRAAALHSSGELGDADGERAEDCWRRAIAIDDHPGAMLDLAGAMVARNAFVDAVALAIRAAHVTRRRLEEPVTDRRWTTSMGAGSAASREQLAHWLEAAMDLVNQHRTELYDAALDGDAAACFEWGRVTSLGFGDVPDPDEGRTWLEQAASQGDAHALHALAQSDRRAGDMDGFETRLRAAADLGHPSALHDLGYALYSGTFGGGADVDGAIAAYRQAAGPDHPSTATDLSFVLEEVPGPEAAEESVRWLQVAADAGDVAALRRFGERARDGDGVARDLGAATQWFLAAYYRGWDDAIDAVSGFAAEVDPRVIAAADRRADGTGFAASAIIAAR